MDVKFPFSRRIHLRTHDGERTVTITIGGIEKIDDHTYACKLSLPLIGREDDRILGADPIQAMDLCLKTIRKLLADAIQDGLIEMWWVTPGDNGGFGGG